MKQLVGLYSATTTNRFQCATSPLVADLQLSY